MAKKTPAQQPDTLIGKTVRIKDGALPGRMGPHPWAGMSGEVTGRKPGGGDYFIDIEHTEVVASMSEFDVLATVPDNAPIDVVAPRLLQIPPAEIVASTTNPRRRRGLDLESLQQLAANIKVHGLAQPILVRTLPPSRLEETAGYDPRPGYELVAGERRWRACSLAELPNMPVLVRELTDAQVLELQLVENIEREDLDPMEEAEGFQLLRTRLGYTVEQIAERIGRGKGHSYVLKTLKLCQLTPESREAMYDGRLSRSTGLLVARYPANKQAEVIKYIASRAQDGEPAPFRLIAPELARRFHLVLKDAVFEIKDASLVTAAGACTVTTPLAASSAATASYPRTAGPS